MEMGIERGGCCYLELRGDGVLLIGLGDECRAGGGGGAGERVRVVGGEPRVVVEGEARAVGGRVHGAGARADAVPAGTAGAAVQAGAAAAAGGGARVAHLLRRCRVRRTQQEEEQGRREEEQQPGPRARRRH